MAEGRSIAVNAALVGDRPTGLAAYVVNIVCALDRLGERLTVFTSRPELFRTLEHVRVQPAPTSLRLERGAAGHVLRLAWTQLVFRSRVARTGARVVLNCLPEGPLPPPVAQVTVVHDLIPLHYPEDYPRQQLYFRRYVPRVLRASRTVVASSDSTGRDLKRFYGLPDATIRVIPLGYDPDRFGPGPRPPSEPPYALYVGNLLPHKNLLRLLDAFAASAPPAARLVICGWGRRSHVLSLEARVAALGLGERVQWRSYVGNGELVGLYRGARMLLLPSLHEGFGLTTLEAMACGTPVVAANRSSLPEVVGDAALLVDPGDTATIADAIRRLFSDDRLAAELSTRGLDRAKLFPWERAAERLRAVLRDASA